LRGVLLEFTLFLSSCSRVTMKLAHDANFKPDT
jgi:hypothetical protein